MAKQNVMVELFYDGAWNDHTSSIYARSPIDITRGRGDEQGEPTPSACSLTFDNRTGNFNPRNASGALFGKIGRNTPIRVSVGPGPSLLDTFTRSASNTWAGGLSWTHSGGTVPDDYDVNGTHGTHTHPAAGVLHHSTVDTGGVDHRVRATVKLSAGTLTAGNASAWVLGRFTDTANYYAALVSFETDGDVTIGIYKRVGGVLTNIAANVVTHAGYSGLFATYQFTVELLIEGSTLRARIWDSSNHVEPEHWNRTVTDTSLTTGTGAGVTDRREAGNTNANLQFQYDSFLAVPGTIRFTGEVSSWKPRRAVKGDAWTDVTAAGVLRRTEHAGTLRSLVHRTTVREATARAYWPLEGTGADPGLLASPIAGVPAATLRASGSTVLRPVTWADNTTLPGSAALPALNTEHGVAGVEADVRVVPAPAVGVAFWTRSDVPPKDAANSLFTQTTFSLALAGSSVPRCTATLLQFPPGSSFATSAATGSATARGSSATDTGASINTVSADIGFVDGWRHVYVRFSTSGADVAVSVRVDAVEVAAGTLPATSLGNVVWMRLGVFTQDTGSTQVGRVSFGHPVILAGSTAAMDDAAARIYFGGIGRPTELAADRISRLAGEESLGFTLVGAAVDTEQMGPQPIDTFNAIVAECERTDAGRLYETRMEAGLTYRTRKAAYNPAADLTLDFDGGQIAPGLEPDIDDLHTRNDVTVKRPDGTFARAVQETGPLNVQDPRDDPDGVGRYAPPDVEVNPASDAVLPQHAGWRLHLGTVPDTRYPAVTVDLDAAPALATAASRLDVGGALAVDNLPDETGTVLLLVTGYTETIGTHRRLITYNCEPATPYRVFVLDTDELDDPAVVLAL